MSQLGIDIGGTKIVLALGDEQGEPIRSTRAPMPLSGDWEADLRAVAALAETLLREATQDDISLRGALERIGVSVPGPIDADRGVLINPPNLTNWQDVPIGPWLAEKFGVETRIENDANAAALAEARFGAGRGVDDLVYLTMSTGVGAGVIAGGRLIAGSFGSAGEAGHMPIELGGRLCACGLSGCFEAYVGGNAWRERLRAELPIECRAVELAKGDRSAVTPEHLVSAAKQGDAVALAEFDRWLDDVVRGIVPIVMLLEPSRIILGTIAVAAGESLCFEPLRKKLARVLWPQQSARVEVVPAALGRALPERAGLAVAMNARSARSAD